MARWNHKISLPSGTKLPQTPRFNQLWKRYDDPLLIAAGRRNPLVRRRGVKLAELVNEPWALPAKENPFGAIVAEAFRVNGLEYPRITVVTGHNELRESLLVTGRFLTIFAKSIFGFSVKRAQLRALSIQLPVAHMPVGIFTLKNRTLSPVAQLFIQHTRDIARAT